MDSEIVTQFKAAINAVAGGEKPWEIEKLRPAIESPALDSDEKKEVSRYLEAKKKELAAAILNAELTKVLVGAQDNMEAIGEKARNLGAPVNVPQPNTPYSGILRQQIDQVEQDLWAKKLQQQKQAYEDAQQNRNKATNMWGQAIESQQKMFGLGNSLWKPAPRKT